MNREPDLVRPVPQEVLPWFAPWRQAPDEKFCKEGFGLGLRVYDPQSSLGGGES